MEQPVDLSVDETAAMGFNFLIVKGSLCCVEKGVPDSIIIKLCTVDLGSLGTDQMSLFYVYADMYFLYGLHDVS